jgi:hypothetical protein
VNVYEMLKKLTSSSTMSETDKKAALEVIKKIQDSNVLGYMASIIESDTDETKHVHVIETGWDDLNAGKLIDKCRDCGERIGHPYDPNYTGGYRGTAYRRSW